jgi:hypothetical protein
MCSVSSNESDIKAMLFALRSVFSQPNNKGSKSSNTRTNECASNSKKRSSRHLPERFQPSRKAKVSCDLNEIAALGNIFATSDSQTQSQSACKIFRNERKRDCKEKTKFESQDTKGKSSEIIGSPEIEAPSEVQLPKSLADDMKFAEELDTDESQSSQIFDWDWPLEKFARAERQQISSISCDEDMPSSPSNHEEEEAPTLPAPTHSKNVAFAEYLQHGLLYSTMNMIREVEAYFAEDQFIFNPDELLLPEQSVNLEDDQWISSVLQ